MNSTPLPSPTVDEVGSFGLRLSAIMLPDVESARGMLNEMLLARIEIRRIHFLSRRVQEFSALVAKRHPEAASGGFEPTIPAFP